MSEPRERDDDRPGSESPQARVHAPRWSPWVWLIPAAALFLIGWLVVRYGMGGGDITVRFADAQGLDRYSPVKFRGVKVGTVEKLTVDKSLGQVVVRIAMDRSMNDALRKGTKFWIVAPTVGGSGLGGLLSGTYVGVAPGQGETAHEFAGQEYAPVLSQPEAGKTFVLDASDIGAITVGSPIQFHGMRVGEILGAEYDAKRSVTSIHAFVVDRFANDVRQGTRFWRGAGIDVSLAGGGLSVKGASLSSFLAAPISFVTPDVLAGPAMPTGTHFDLYDSESAATAAADGSQITYLTYFTGPVQGLAPGTAVRMRGVQVGSVREVRLRYLPATATLETPVTLEIDPRKLELPINESTTREEVRATMNDALQKLVQKGMRASLDTSLVLPGASGISLEITAAPGTGHLVLTNDPPIIPAAAGGNGLAGAMASISKVANTVGNLPLQEIADHLRSTSSRLDTLVHDPRLDESIRNLNASLAEIEKVSRTAQENVGPIAKNLHDASQSAASAAKTADDTVKRVAPQVDPLVQSLRNAADAAEAAAKRAEQLVGSAPKQNYDIGELIKELTRAAESVRALASYLTENPDSLLKGRRK